ncbi:MAG: lipopolysaccharide biosynthesis protein, partial [bacterium]
MKENIDVFIKRLFGFSIGPIVSAMLGFLSVPITTWLVSPDNFGKASMFTMAISLISLFLYLGLDQAFVREFNAVKNKQELLWNSIIIPLVFSIGSSIIIIFYSKEISVLLFGSYEKFIIKIVAAAIPIIVIRRFNELIIRMQEKAKLYSAIIITQKLIDFLLLIVLLLYFEKSFKSIIFANILSQFIIVLISIFINRSFWKYKFTVNKALINKLIKFGLPIVPASIFGWLLHSMDKIALRSFADFSELGIYATAFKIVTLVNIIKQSFGNFWIPTAYRWYEDNVENSHYEKVSHFLMVILALVFSGIILSKDWIFLLLGAEYRNASIIVPFLLFYPLMNTLVSTTNLGIVFLRKTFYKIPIFAITSLLNLFGNYLLVPRMGALGA